MDPIQVMVVGIGQWGRNWIGTLQADDRYKIVALVDELPGQAAKACFDFGLGVKSSFMQVAEAIRNTHPAAAVITVPPAFHLNVAMQCLAAGIHVLSEKPLANNVAEAYTLLDEANRSGVQFMVSQDYRWQPPVQTVRSLIREGRIGEVGYITFRHFQCHHLGGWREQMQDVVLEDMTIHHFDLIRYLTGKECTRVFSQTFNPAWSWYRGGAVAEVQLTFEGGIHVNYLGTWVTQGWVDISTTGEIRIEGSRGSLILKSNGEVLLYADGKSAPVNHLRMEATGRDYALQEFYQAVTQGVTPETTIADNIHSYVITQAALKSSKEDQPVEMKEFDDKRG